MIRLEDVNETNWRYSLHVSEVQKETMPQRAYMRSWALWRQAAVTERKSSWNCRSFLDLHCRETHKASDRFQKIKKIHFLKAVGRMKIITRTEYLNRILALNQTPDIKIITSIRRSEKYRF